MKKTNDRAIVLTTHSMEEADVLCNRIGIVNQGVMRCLGTQARLKLLYGGGFHLFVNCMRYLQDGGSDLDKSRELKNF